MKNRLEEGIKAAMIDTGRAGRNAGAGTAPAAVTTPHNYLKEE